jgi:hypothetical protein
MYREFPIDKSIECCKKIYPVALRAHHLPEAKSCISSSNLQDPQPLHVEHSFIKIEEQGCSE